MESINEIKKIGTWIELTNLLIPGYNDKKGQIEKLVKWVKENLGTRVPLHFSAFYPTFKLLNVQRTLPETLIKAKKIALKQFNYIIQSKNIINFIKEINRNN